MKNKDYFIQKTAEDLNVEVSLVDKIITTSYKDLIRVISHTDVSKVEIGGLGKLNFNISKAEKKLDKLYARRDYLEQKINSYKIVPVSQEEEKRTSKIYSGVLRDIKNIENKLRKDNE